MTKKEPNKRGPNANHLKIKGNWQDAVKKAIGKKKPLEGWPGNKKSES